MKGRESGRTMTKFVIQGGIPLTGTVTASGAKNAILPMLAASVMATSPCVFHNAPHLADVSTMLKILERMGAKVERGGHNGSSLYVDPSSLDSHIVDEMLMRQVR